MTDMNDTTQFRDDHGGSGTGTKNMSLRSFARIGTIVLAFLAAGIAGNLPGFNALMVYDGAYFINSKEPIFASHDVLSLISIVPVRPLFLFTFYLNYLFTGMDPFYFRLLNAIMVALSGMALAMLAMMIFKIPGLPVPGTRRTQQYVALFLGLLFAVHPLQSLVVLYAWQREAIMACLFYFSSLAAYLATRSGRFKHSIWGYVLTSGLFLAGMLSKENVATLPVIALLAEVTLMRQTLRQAFKRGLIITVVFLPSVLAYLLVTNLLHMPHSELVHGIVDRLMDHYKHGGLNFFEVVLTQCRIFFSYVFMMLFPFVRDVEFMRAETISRSLLNPPATLAAVGGVIALMGTGLLLIRRSPLISFGMLFMIVVLLPESLLIPQYLFFGYRAILPMAGLLLIVGTGVLYLGDRVHFRSLSRTVRVATALGMVVLLVGLGLVTASRASRWNHISFWTDLADRLPTYSKDVETVPFLDITVNGMSTLVDGGQNDRAIDLFQRKLAFKQESKSSGVDDDDIRQSVDAFLEVFKDETMRSGGALIALGAALQVTGKIDDAMTAYQEAVELEPHHIDVHLTLGAMLENQGKLNDAMKHYRKAVEIDPHDALAHNCLGNAFKREGYLRKAMEQFYEAVQADPDSPDGYLNLGRGYQDAGYYKEAVDLYENALEIDPNSAESHHMIGRAMAEIGNGPEALNHYRKAVELNPGLAEAQSDLALALEHMGKLAEAIQHHRKAVQADPASALNYALLGRSLSMAGHIAEALQALNRALELDPNSATAHHYAGVALEKSGKVTQAVQQLKKAIELEPSDAAAHTDLAVALLKQRRFTEAIKSLKTAMSLDPNDPTACLYLGKALDAVGNSRLAQEYYKRAVTIKPDFSEALYDLANSSLRNHNDEEAIKGYSKVLKLSPDLPEAHARMATALLRVGKIPEAIVELGKAMTLDKENTEVLHALGMAFFQVNKKPEARRYFEKALDQDPDHEGAKEYLRRLEGEGKNREGAE